MLCLPRSILSLSLFPQTRSRKRQAWTAFAAIVLVAGILATIAGVFYFNLHYSDKMLKTYADTIGYLANGTRGRMRGNKIFSIIVLLCFPLTLFHV